MGRIWGCWARQRCPLDAMSCVEDSVWKHRQRAPRQQGCPPEEGWFGIHSLSIAPADHPNLPGKWALILIIPVSNRNEGFLSTVFVLGHRTCSMPDSHALLTSSYKETPPHFHIQQN